MATRVSVLAFVIAALVAALSGNTARGAFSGANGKLAFVRTVDGNSDIWVSNADFSNPTRLTTDPAVDRSPRWSPDGTHIAFASNRDGDFEIFVMNAKGGNQRQVTFNTGENDRIPAWTPDATQIVYDKNFAQVFVINSDGTGGERSVTSDGFVPATSPHGDTVVFSRGDPANLFSAHLDGSGLSQITSGAVGGFNADWSPQGSNLVFAGGLNGVDDNDVFSIRADGSGVRDLTNTPGTQRVEFSPVWSPDGSRIAFDGCVDFFTSPRCELYVMNRDGSGETQISTFGVLGGTGAIDWQPIPKGGAQAVGPDCGLPLDLQSSNQDLSGCNLHSVTIGGSGALQVSNLSGANLKQATISGSVSLFLSNLRGADLRVATISGYVALGLAVLSGGDLRGATISGVDALGPPT